MNFDDDEVQILRMWYRIVELYSKRELTHGRDILPALSALASRSHQAFPDQYLAGLWRRDLFAGVHRHTTNYDQDLRCNSTRPANLRPPSWTWTACDRNVELHLKGNTTSTPSMEIMDAATVVPGQDPFGEVGHGRLLIKGKLRIARPHERAVPLPDHYWAQHTRKTVTRFYATGLECSDQDVAGMYPDDEFGEALRDIAGLFEPLYCLLLGHHVVHPKDGWDDVIFVQDKQYWTALALKPLGPALDRFVRVGLLISDNYAATGMFPGLGLDRDEGPSVLGLTRTWWDDASVTTLEVV